MFNLRHQFSSSISNFHSKSQTQKCKSKFYFGFTLMELIIVIVVLAILATIAFLSFNSYSAVARDSKRMSNVSLIAKWFEINIVMWKPIDTTETSIVPNIVLSWSTVAYVWYYDSPVRQRLMKSLGVWWWDIDLWVDSFQNYKYTYVPAIQKYQVVWLLESQTKFGVSYIDSHWFIDSLWLNNSSLNESNINMMGSLFAEDSWSWYIFLKWNYFATWWVEWLIPKQEVWDFATWSTKVIPWDKIVVNWTTNEPTDAWCSLSWILVNHLGTIDAFSETSIIWNAWYICDNRKITRTCNNWILSWDDSYRYDSCVKWTPSICSASWGFIENWHTYSIPSLNHSSWAINILSSNVSENNWIFKYTLSNIECNDWTYINVNENWTQNVLSCNSWYGINGNICSASQNWSCNNPTPLGCSIWSAINDNWSVSCGTTRTWNCSWLYGGSSSVQCSKANASCPTSWAYTYWSWWSCSVSCWWWTQTRPEYCSYDSCYSAQSTSQSCNTQSCCTPTRQDYRTSCSVSCWWWTTYHYQWNNWCWYSPSYVWSNSCNTQSCCTSWYARNNSYSACTKSVSFIMDCSDSSNAASWYKWKWRCWDTGGINYWNWQISVVWYSAANNQFNINYANDVAASWYWTNVTAYYNWVLCWWATYITNTNLCRQ